MLKPAFLFSISLLLVVGCGGDPELDLATRGDLLRPTIAGGSEQEEAEGVANDLFVATRDPVLDMRSGSILSPQRISSALVCAPDQDEDGYGDALAPLTLALHACPSGFVDNNQDCADEDSRAFPGQTLFFVTPAIGNAIDPWDFDCDGVAEQQYPDPPLSCSTQTTEIDCTQWSDQVSSHTGWAQSVPECGKSGKVTTGWGCIWANDTCLANIGGDRIQACR